MVIYGKSSLECGEINIIFWCTSYQSSTMPVPSTYATSMHPKSKDLSAGYSILWKFVELTRDCSIHSSFRTFFLLFFCWFCFIIPDSRLLSLLYAWTCWAAPKDCFYAWDLMSSCWAFWICRDSMNAGLRFWLWRCWLILLDWLISLDLFSASTLFIQAGRTLVAFAQGWSACWPLCTVLSYSILHPNFSLP